MGRLAQLFRTGAIAGAVLICFGASGFASPWQNGIYTVRNDPGGYVIDYAIKLKQLEMSQHRVRFDGRCDSACTVFLSLPKSRICVTPGARFGFHLPYGSSPRGNQVAANYLLNSYPAWVRAWLNANGGLSHRLKVMRYEHASRFIEPCAAAPRQLTTAALNAAGR
jgi:hypothetical protein